MSPSGGMLVHQLWGDAQPLICTLCQFPSLAVGADKCDIQSSCSPHTYRGRAGWENRVPARPRSHPTLGFLVPMHFSLLFKPGFGFPVLAMKVCVCVHTADSSEKDRKMPGGSLSETMLRWNLKARGGLWKVKWGWEQYTQRNRGVDLFQKMYLDGTGVHSRTRSGVG